MGMDLKSSAIVYRTSLILCVLATLGLGIQSLRKYLLDENTTQVNHIKFNYDDPGNLYPSITLCVANPFIENELQRYEKDFSIQKYFEFLRGKIWDERMMAIDYNKVTVSLMDSLIGVKMWLENRSAYQYDHINGKQSPVGWIPHFYVKEKLAAKKCFSFDIPFINKSPVFKFQIYFKKSLFPQEYKTRASRFDPNSSTFALQLHYPGQRIFSKVGLNQWSSKTKQPKPYDTAITISNVIVTVYRSRKKGQCINDWLNYDQIITDEQVVKAGCQPRHWITDKQLPICNSHDDMKEFAKQIENLKWKTRPPCKVIRSMELTHKDYEYSKKAEARDDFPGLAGIPNRSYFVVTARFPEVEFTETRQVKAFDFNDLLGNIGGYIGMFLGYALLNLAYYIADLFDKLKTRYSESVMCCQDEKKAQLKNKTSVPIDKN